MSDQKIEPTLFIGGPADGKWMSVKSSRVSIPERCSIPQVSEQFIPVDRFSAYTHTTYTRAEIPGEYKYFHVMVCDGISTDEMISALIDGYKHADRQGD